MSRTNKPAAVFAFLVLLGWTNSAFAGAVAYTYDNLGRVKTVTRPDGSVTTYTYDAAYNRTHQTTQRTDFIVVPIAGKPLIYLPPRS